MMRLRYVLVMGVVLLLSLGCGGGGGSGGVDDNQAIAPVAISGQALLGPLSGAGITIAGLDGTVLATATAIESADLETAGTFSLALNDSDIPEVVLVIADGGVDIDPQDGGVPSSGVSNRGVVHAYLTKEQLTGGPFKINPLTEVIYQDLALRFPGGLGHLSLAEISEILDTYARKYHSQAVGYAEVLSFVPSRDKDDSRIAWEVILGEVVSAIHGGEAVASIRNRVALLQTHLQPPGVTTNAEGDNIQRVEEVAGGRVRTVAGATGVGLVEVLGQEYVDASGAVVFVRVERMSEERSYLSATVTKAGHILKFEGVTSLLNGLAFSEAEIAALVSKLVSIESADETSLEITIDKSLAARISDNELSFTVDGREPAAEELSVILDDPRINWKWSTADQFVPQIIAAGHELSGYPGSDLRLLSDGTVVIELSAHDYEKVSGLRDDADTVVRDGFKHLAGVAADALNMALISLEVGLLTSEGEGALRTLMNSFLSTPQAYYWVLTAGLPVIAERNLTSTRIGLIGMFEGQDQTKIIPGEKYIPILFLKNNLHADGTVFDLSVNMRYSTFANPDTVIETYNNPAYHHLHSQAMASITAGKNKGYIVIPSKELSFFISASGNTFFQGGTPRVTLQTGTNRWEWATGRTFEISTTQQSIYADFLYILERDQVYLDASPSVSSDGTVLGYSWRHKDVEIATGRTARVAVAEIDSGDGFGEVTLVMTTLLNTGMATKRIPLDAKHWNSAVKYREDFSINPGYSSLFSSNVASTCNLSWNSGNFFAKVADTSNWYCLAGSPTFSRVDQNDGFRIEFSFNPVKPDWGHYPGIYFADSGTSFPADTWLRALSFTINWSDDTYRKFVLLGNDGSRFYSPTIPAANEWYNVVITKDKSTKELSLQIFRQNGSVFVDVSQLKIGTGSFDRLFIGETQLSDPNKYGNSAEIRIDNILVQ